MSSPLDPRTWVSGLMGVPTGDRSVLDAWMDLTSWWVEPTVAATRALRGGSDQVLVQLIDGVMAQFGGRGIELTVRGRRVTAVLDSIGLQRRAERRELRVDLSDVDAGDISFGDLHIVARSVTLDIGTSFTLRADGIEVEGRTPFAGTIDRLRDVVHDWRLETAPDGSVWATHPRLPGAVGVEGEVVDGEALIEVRRYRARGRSIRLPRLLRIERRVPVELGDEWTMRSARRDGADLVVRLHADGIVEPLDARRLRDAILRGQRLPL